jgi:hypothetical protein
MTSRTDDNPERTFAALKPAALDELSEDAYLRRREADLSRAMTATRARPRRVGPGRNLMLPPAAERRRRVGRNSPMSEAVRGG